MDRPCSGSVVLLPCLLTCTPRAILQTPLNTLTETSASPAGPPRPWLLADIGATNARFGWLPAGANALIEVRSLPAADHAGPTDAALAYLADLAGRLGTAYTPPRAAAFAVATATGSDLISFTNSGWSLSCTAARQRLGVERFEVLNDFEALALSLPRLGASQLQPIGPLGLPRAAGTLAVIGPGTGLGVAGLLQTAHGWVALPGEGGHATLSAADEFDSALLAAVRRAHAHVSAERLLSGIGLPLLFAALAEVLGESAAAAHPPTASQIVERALAGDCALCSRTVDSFCALLGSFAGNVALTLGARGGVYIGGGIVPRLGARFQRSQFRQRFEAKGRFQPYLQAIPTALITDTLAALAGAAQALGQSPSRA